MPLSFSELHGFFRRGLRNGNWRFLSFMEKGFYMAVLSYAKKKGRIVNMRLVSAALSIIGKLKLTEGDRILKAGFDRVRVMAPRYEELKVFSWAPRLKDWFKEPGFIFWFGLSARLGSVYRR